MTREDLWKQLSESGLVQGELPIDEPQSPWPVRIMLGVAGWMGALFLLGFVGAALSFLFRGEGAAFVGGLICCGAAYAIFRFAPRGDMLGQFGFAVSLVGQALLVVALVKISGEFHALTWLALALVEAILAFLLPNYVHRVVTTFFAIFCFTVGTVGLGAHGAAAAAGAAGTAWIWLEEEEMAAQPSFWEPLGFGFVLGLLHQDGSLLFGQDLWRMLLPRESSEPATLLLWAGPLVTGAVFVYTVRRLLGNAALVPAVVVAACGLLAPGISAAMLVLALGFANGNRVLMGFGLLALGGYLFHYYYQLQLTLLLKSAVLLGTGVALLALRYAMGRLRNA